MVRVMWYKGTRLYRNDGGLFLGFGRIYIILMKILSFGVQAPGLDPGVGEMFRFVGPIPGNRVLFLRIAPPLPDMYRVPLGL
jgi:hypothetical protein